MAVVRGIEGAMSEVISFRLNGDNAREKRACEILKTWRQQGYPVRQLIVEALLLWENNQALHSKEQNATDLAAVNAKLTTLIDLLVEKNNHSQDQNSQEDQTKKDLSPLLLTAIRENFQPGMKPEQEISG